VQEKTDDGSDSILVKLTMARESFPALGGSDILEAVEQANGTKTRPNFEPRLEGERIPSAVIGREVAGKVDYPSYSHPLEASDDWVQSVWIPFLRSR